MEGRENRLPLLLEASVVLLGDLNDWNPTGRTGRWLRSFFAPAAAPRTYPSRSPIFALDRMLVYPQSMRAAVQIHRSAPAKIALDHLPVKAEIPLPRIGNP